ncbi:MAG TPA: hypothetical protein VF274_08185 [Alphaproteobacteria bacterium]
MIPRWLGLGLVGLCVAGAAAGQSAAPAPHVILFERFIELSTPVCRKQASMRCVDAGWRYADTDRDGLLSAAELEVVRKTATDWYNWKASSLSSQERASIGLGLAVAEGMGVERLMQGYDTDGDGRLSKAEALVDVHLDERPLGDVLRDPKALDRQATARRMGIAGPLFSQLFR